MGDRIAVRENDTQWDSETGQLVMDFKVASAAGSVSFISQRAAPRARVREDDPDALFARAEELEASDGGAAERVYRRVLELVAGYANAYLNLGFMLCEAGRCEEAVQLYEAAVLHCADDPLVHYNRAVALEALGRVPEALASYETCLRLQPDAADAHQNAALLYAQAGEKQLAIRHFSAYRRLRPQG